jgi:hypothetical protein
MIMQSSKHSRNDLSVIEAVDIGRRLHDEADKEA